MTDRKQLNQELQLAQLKWRACPPNDLKIKIVNYNIGFLPAK